jgi:hypothetical protein
MKIKTVLAIFVIFAQIVLGQTGNLQITTQKITGNEVNWETMLSLNIPAQVQSGFVLELPAGVHLVPISIELNSRALWLQNGIQAADVDSVVTWSLGASRIFFLFSPGQLNSADRLEIKSIAALNAKRLAADNTFNLRPYGADQSSGEIFASAALPAEWLGEARGQR